MLRLMLDHHPEIACHYEFEFSVDWVTEDGQMPSVDEVRGRFKEPWLRGALTAPGCEGVFPDVATHEEFVNWKLCAWRDAGGKRDVGATCHRNFERLLHIWPDARFIHVLRDGRDVARSRVQMGWHGNAWTAIDAWIEVESAWGRLCAALPEDRRHEVRYEQLIQSPREVLSGICAFLGHSFSDRMFDYVEKTNYDLPDATNARQWRLHAEPAEVSLMEAKAGRMLEARGYELSGFEPALIGEREAARLQAECAVKRRKMRIARYGLPLLVARKVAVATSCEALRRWVEERMYRINQRYFK